MACKIFLHFLFFSSFLSKFCLSFKHNNSYIDHGFLPAVATWYKDPTIAGSGGACGLENDIANPPYNGMITAGNHALFKHGKGCGACYQVKCKASPLCSDAPIMVTLTDECPGTCNNDPVHFDLSWIAFGFLVKKGRDNPLRKLGRIDVQYRRVPCHYGRSPIMFKVDKGSNPYWLAVSIENENGDGEIEKVEFQPVGSKRWLQTKQVFGGTYGVDLPEWAKGHTMSIRLTQSGSKRSIVAKNAVPRNWQHSQRYWAKYKYVCMSVEIDASSFKPRTRVNMVEGISEYDFQGSADNIITQSGNLNGLTSRAILTTF